MKRLTAIALALFIFFTLICAGVLVTNFTHARTFIYLVNHSKRNVYAWVRSAGEEGSSPREVPSGSSVDLSAEYVPTMFHVVVAARADPASTIGEIRILEADQRGNAFNRRYIVQYPPFPGRWIPHATRPENGSGFGTPTNTHNTESTEVLWNNDRQGIFLTRQDLTLRSFHSLSQTAEPFPRRLIAGRRSRPSAGDADEDR